MTATQPQPVEPVVHDNAFIHDQEQAFFTQEGIEVEMPDGRRVAMKSLPWKRAAHYLGLWHKTLLELSAGEFGSFGELLATWPEETGLLPGSVTPNEVLWLMRRFFTLRGWIDKSPATTVSPAPSPPPAGGA